MEVYVTVLIDEYRCEVFRDESGYVSRVVELPGCITQGDSFEELFSMLRDAIKCWLAAAGESD